MASCKTPLRHFGAAVYRISFQQEVPMSAPSRRPEIRRRRTRKQKILILRRRYAAAKSDADRHQIFARARLLSPSLTLEQFTSPLEGAGGR